MSKFHSVEKQFTLNNHCDTVFTGGIHDSFLNGGMIFCTECANITIQEEGRTLACCIKQLVDGKVIELAYSNTMILTQMYLL
jgi:hypothetical protein